ncbi:MAG: type II toxin-antitoxin system VapC family toxin [Sphingomonadales bacterium]|nr:type II toxin-antitoxin system VapC family toxin [Sphingomonadales bacterium]
MIVDSSALIAILKREPGCDQLRERLLFAKGGVRLASPSYLEASIVVDGWRDATLSGKFDDLIQEFEIEIVPFTADHAHVAREAYRDFGKGSGHPAKLNFGDSIAYALARSERAPLLFVGDDFPHTDIEPA